MAFLQLDKDFLLLDKEERMWYDESQVRNMERRGLCAAQGPRLTGSQSELYKINSVLYN